MIMIKASEFKAKCLKMMDDVLVSGEYIVITKHGKPVARLMPYRAPAGEIFGFLQGELAYKGDLANQREESWEAWDEERNLQ